jgi:hypothetical protein
MKSLSLLVFLSLLTKVEAKPIPCQDVVVFQRGCQTMTPVKDILVPGRKALGVAPIRLNQDTLLDLVVQGDGGTGGSMIYVFFQESAGVYTLKGSSFAHSIYLDLKKEVPSIIFQSKSGFCRQNFQRMDFERDGYEEKSTFIWHCVNEAQTETKFQVEELKGSWPDERIMVGFQGEYAEILSLMPGQPLKFLQMNEKFQLIMQE